jgi:hypothetical protein
MPRDRWLLELLGEHQAFTTEQVTALAFDHIHTARNRLNLLNSRGVLARFRDAVRPGSQSFRWTTGIVGDAWLAYRAGKAPPKPATVANRVNALAASPRLAHVLGVNGTFVDLAAHARHTPVARLDVWWSERRCREVTGELVRPDGHGVWTEDGTTIGFWLEYDRATETTGRRLAKIDDYLALREATGLGHAVLIWVQTRRQETELHKRLCTHPAVVDGGLVVATASGGHHPAEPVWLVAGHTTRLRLANLPTNNSRA